VLRPREADALVLVSHEGGTALTLEAARAFDGPVWLVTGKSDSPLGELADEVVVATPEIEKSWCHTAS
jgi:D-arabinose 5-phosphate isomerase GutQ